jgi:signal transduction histidine kinase
VEKAKNLERYFQDRLVEVKILSEPNKFQSIFFNYHKDFETDFFRMYFERFINTNNYYRKIVFLDANNKLLVINKSGYPNTQISNNQHQFYIKISKDIATNTIQLTDYKTEDDSSFHFFIISKIYDKQEARYLGTLVFDLFTTSINNIMFDYSQYNGLGNTGESYIVGQDFLMRTSSRFKENSINKIKVKTQASINAISGQTGQILTKDYRNVEVLSSYAPLKIAGLNWVIIAEMDLKEALKPIYNLRNNIIIISVILSLIIFILVYIGSKKITNPIIKLNEAATKISKGQFNIKIIPQSNDEIGELINSFNNMSNQLALQSEQIAKDKLFRISAVIDAQEVERQRLSRDIHDGLGQMLLAIKFKLEKIEKLSFGTVKSQVQETIYLIKNSINEIRAISNNLMPTVLANFGLEEGIKRLCNDSLNSAHILCDFSFQSTLHNSIDNRKQIYIFRFKCK